ncbi:hypothetical protein ACTA71_000155 [Dictyostelium dimigraforme]
MKVHLPLVFTIFLLVNFCFSTSIGYTVNNDCIYKGIDGKSYDLNSIGYLEFSSPTISNATYALNLCAALNGTQPCGKHQNSYICRVQDGFETSMALTSRTPIPINKGYIIALQYGGPICGFVDTKVYVLFQCGSSDNIVSVYQSKGNALCSPDNFITIEAI